jgi:hypothetical protein
MKTLVHKRLSLITKNTLRGNLPLHPRHVGCGFRLAVLKWIGVGWNFPRANASHRMRVSLGSPRGPMNVRAARLNLVIPIIFFRSSADVGSSLALFHIKVQIGGFYVGCAWMQDVVLDIGTGLRMDLVSLKNIKDGVSQIPPVPPVWLFPLRALSRDGIGRPGLTQKNQGCWAS